MSFVDVNNIKDLCCESKQQRVRMTRFSLTKTTTPHSMTTTHWQCCHAPTRAACRRETHWPNERRDATQAPADANASAATHAQRRAQRRAQPSTARSLTLVAPISVARSPPSHTSITIAGNGFVRIRFVVGFVDRLNFNVEFIEFKNTFNVCSLILDLSQSSLFLFFSLSPTSSLTINATPYIATMFRCLNNDIIVAS
jgi:hypothetical protein